MGCFGSNVSHSTAQHAALVITKLCQHNMGYGLTYDSKVQRAQNDKINQST